MNRRVQDGVRRVLWVEDQIACGLDGDGIVGVVVDDGEDRISAIGHRAAVLIQELERELAVVSVLAEQLITDEDDLVAALVVGIRVQPSARSSRPHRPEALARKFAAYRRASPRAGL